MSSAPDSPAAPTWYTVRCFFRWTNWSDAPYEERITLWRAGSFDEAMALGEREAAAYAEDGGFELLPLTQVFVLDADGGPAHGSEVFSLLHRTDLAPETYLDQFDRDGGTDQP
ncbi:hypothetical protein AB0C76_29555 [Kitasatospora sp. NPDC048722]|uniref:hypothetical protein n=1 Tax=Kitasatospora sp. NPDC048722 TaxID=3155639 RepID=UPI0033D06CBC